MMILSLILATASAAATAKSETLWKEWYLISQKGVAVGYFEETAERRTGEKQLAITQKWVEKMDGKAETYIGSVAEESRLKPVAFFVDRKVGGDESKTYKTDGRVKDKKLEITFKPASASLSKSTEVTSLQPSMYFSSFVPMAVARHFKEKGPLNFVAVVEDGGSMNVEVKKGLAEVQKDEKKIGSENCRSAIIHFGGQLQQWWITKAGKVCLVEFPDSKMKMELSDEQAARKAVD